MEIDTGLGVPAIMDRRDRKKGPKTEVVGHNKKKMIPVGVVWCMCVCGGRSRREKQWRGEFWNHHNTIFLSRETYYGSHSDRDLR